MTIPKGKAVAALLVLVALSSSAEVLAKEKETDPPGNHGQPENNGNNGNNPTYDADDNGQTTAPGQIKKDAGSVPAATASPVPDQDLALDAVEDNRALPLEVITSKVAQSGGGQVIDARLVTVNGFLLYELKVLDGGQLEIQYYYARSGVRVGD